MSNPGDRWRRWWMVAAVTLAALAALLLARCATDDTASTPPVETTVAALETLAPVMIASTTTPATTAPPTTAAPTTQAPTTVADTMAMETETVPAVETQAVEDIAKLVELEGVGFDSGSATLNDAGISTLQKIAASLLAVPDLNLTIDGYTDSSGDAAANLALSQARAEAVKQFLVNKGVAADRLTPVGHGADNPIDDNATPEGRAKNRRIEFVRN